MSFHTDLPVYQDLLCDHIVERAKRAPKYLEDTEMGAMSEDEIRAYITERCIYLSVDDLEWQDLLRLAWATDDVVTTLA